jgi:antitoxin component YwqK of YwqJK toxin-antitoxin module
MSLKYLVPVLLIFLLVSCSPKKIDKSGFTIKNNIVYKNDSDKPYTGIVKTKAKGKNFEYFVREGVKNGDFKITFENGNLIMKGNIINDMNEGKWVYFYPSGELESEGSFRFNKPDSVWVWYFPDGKVKEKGIFVNGLREGIWKMWDEFGNVSMEYEYKNGVGSVLNQK